jgi:hypothetical protein
MAFGKKKAAAAKKLADLAELQKKLLTQIEGAFSEAEDTKDVGEKILKLEQVMKDISYAERQETAVRNQMTQKYPKRALIADVPLAATIIGVIFVGDWADSVRQKRREKLEEKLKGFNEATHLIKAHAWEIKNQALENTSLEELSRSAQFTRIYKEYESIRDRFTAAAAAKAALGEEAAMPAPAKPSPKSAGKRL